MSNLFADTFNYLLTLSGKNLTQLSEITGLDRSYLLRLSTGRKATPSGDVIIRIYIALVADKKLLDREPDLQEGLASLLISAAQTDALQNLLDRERATSVALAR